MKINSKILVFSLLSAFVFLGCSSKEIHKNELVQNKEILKQSPLDENVLYYKNPNFDAKNYNKLAVNKISIIKNENSNQIDEKVLNKITTYLQESLQTKLSNVIKTNKSDNKLNLEIAISNIDVSYKDLRFYQYLPYGLAFTALKRGTGFEQRKLNIQLVLKLTDAKTNKTAILLVDNSIPKDTKNYKALTFENVKPQLDKWISKYELRLKEFNEGKYKKTGIN